MTRTIHGHDIEKSTRILMSVRRRTYMLPENPFDDRKKDMLLKRKIVFGNVKPFDKAST